MTRAALAPVAVERLAVGRLLAPGEVAGRLAVSRSMVYKLLRTGELTAFYVGRLPRIAEADLDAYIENQRRGRR